MSVYPQFKKSVAKTASYALLPTDHDQRFSNVGASGAVTFTLPPIADVWDGWSTEFAVLANQNVTITAPSGKLIAGNNTGATSIAFSTTSEKVGNSVLVYYDGNAAKYVAQVHLATETFTPTIS